jgi:hypothetical protein
MEYWGNSYNFAAGDPYFANVSLLLHGDGADGSTTIVDSSPTPKTVTAVGNAQISTAQSVFGDASILFDGNGDYLRLNGENDFSFGTDDFTIEFWIRIVNALAFQVFIDFRPAGTQGFYPAIYAESGKLNVWINNGPRITSTLNLSANAWTFVALTKSGSSVRLFQQGNQTGSTFTTSAAYLVGAQRPVIGIEGVLLNGGSLNGHMDEIRITKGVARYTANFTPPTAPFPDF